MLVAPPLELCTDNGAMIAWAGAERLALGLTDPLDAAPRARWPLEEVAGAEDAAAHAVVAGRTDHEHSTASPCSAAAPGAPRSPTLRARGRAHGDAVGARRRATPRSSTSSAKADSCPACSIDDSHRGDARSRRRRARRRDPAGGAGAGDARRSSSRWPHDRADGTPVIACAKGIEHGTHKFMTEVIAECAPNGGARDPVRPELRRRRGARPADRGDARRGGRRPWRAIWRRRSAPATFRPYHSTDVRGVEIGGAAKNVLAIASGIVAGRGLGASAAAALTTRGFAELMRFGRALGAQAGDADRACPASAI